MASAAVGAAVAPATAAVVTCVERFSLPVPLPPLHAANARASMRTVAFMGSLRVVRRTTGEACPPRPLLHGRNRGGSLTKMGRSHPDGGYEAGSGTASPRRVEPVKAGV